MIGLVRCTLQAGLRDSPIGTAVEKFIPGNTRYQSEKEKQSCPFSEGDLQQQTTVVALLDNIEYWHGVQILHTAKVRKN